MTTPIALVEACERNRLVWHRQSAQDIDAGFDELYIPRSGELYEFAKRYCLQFASRTMPFQLTDIIEEDGVVSDNVYYAREELRIAPELLPISAWEAEAIFVVNTNDDSVLLLTADDQGDSWNSEILASSFYDFMLDHLD